MDGGAGGASSSGAGGSGTAGTGAGAVAAPAAGAGAAGAPAAGAGAAAPPVAGAGAAAAGEVLAGAGRSMPIASAMSSPTSVLAHRAHRLSHTAWSPPSPTGGAGIGRMVASLGTPTRATAAVRGRPGARTGSRSGEGPSACGDRAAGACAGRGIWSGRITVSSRDSPAPGAAERAPDCRCAPSGPAGPSASSRAEAASTSSDSSIMPSGSSSQSSMASRMPSRSSHSSNSSATGPTPSRTAEGSASTHGASTKARSWARGWGSMRAGSELVVPSTWTMSMSMVRAPQCSLRSRPNSRSIRSVCSSSEDTSPSKVPSTTAFQ